MTKARFIHKCLFSLLCLLFVSCGSMESSSSSAVDVNTKLEALISMQGSLTALVESEYATCSNSGDTTNSLIRKICAVAQSATSEMQTVMLDQLGTLSNALQTQITQLEADLVTNAISVSSRIDSINAVLDTLDSRMTSAESAITALQSAIASLTRTNYKLVKSLADLPAPVGGVITLSANTDYEINGNINIGADQLKFSNGSQLFGINRTTDGIQYTGAGSMFINVANAGFIMHDIKITTASAAKVFDLTGDSSTDICIDNVNLSVTSAALGTIVGGNTIIFYYNILSSTTAVTGLDVSGVVAYLGYSGNNFTTSVAASSANTMLTITGGTFTTISIENNTNLSPNSAGITAFNITSAGPTVTSGRVTNNTCSAANSLFPAVGQVLPSTTGWWFTNNSGLSNSELTYDVGDTGPAGGVVFYDKGSYSAGWRYLEAAPSDQSSSQAWSNITATAIGTTGTAIGTGMANTTAIILQVGHTGSAAYLCHSQIIGGYSNWFLPSQVELNQMYINISGFSADNYWSSSEDSASDADSQSFDDGFQYNDGKNALNYVRCIRAF